MDEQNVIQVGLEFNTQNFEQSLTEAEERFKSAVQRFTGIGEAPQATETQTSSVPQRGRSPNQPFSLGDAQSELDQIKSYAEKAPDIALAAIRGQGGLAQRVAKAGQAEDTEAAQALLQEIKNLTQTLKDAVRTGEDGSVDPATGIMGFLKNDMRLQALSSVGGELMQGNLITAGGSGLGAIIGGFLGGPVGMAAGAGLGQMVSAPIQGLVNASGENRSYDEQVADIAARFGEFDATAELDIEAMNEPRYGYSFQETAGLLDQLREQQVIDEVDGESKELVSEIQALTRALGLNTEVLVANYAEYRRGGGSDRPEDFMAQVLQGAIDSGMQANIQQYSETLLSARGNLVARTFQQDEDDGGMGKIQGLMTDLLGDNSSTSALLRENPALAQQAIQGLVATGGANQYSFDSVAMQMAGIDRGKTDATFLDPEQTVENAIARQQYVIEQFLGGGGLQQMGFGDISQLQEAIAQDPDYLRRVMSAENPNSDQAAALQDLFNQTYRSQFGKLPTAPDFSTFTQLGTAYLENGGQIGASTPLGDGSRVLADLINDSQKTEGQLSREAAEERHTAMMTLLEEFKTSLVSMDRNIATLVGWITRTTQGIQTGYTQATEWYGQGEQIAEDRPLAGAAIGAVSDTILNTTPLGPFGRFFSPVLTGAIGEMLGIAPRADSGGEVEGAMPASVERPTSSLPAGVEEIGPQSFALPGSGETAEAGRLPHDSFRDTPEAGVLARPGYNVFEFAYGDIVTASQNTSGNSESNNFNVMISQTISVGSDANPDLVRAAARQGAGQGLDEFRQQSAAIAASGRNPPKIRNYNY